MCCPGDRDGFPFVYAIVVFVTLGVAALLAISSAVQDSQTQDEAVHLVSGFSYWKTGDFRLSPEHPPFSRLVASLPLLWMHLDFAPPVEAWNRADAWIIGKAFLYSNGIPADSIMMAGRALVILQYLVLAASL